MDRQTVHFHNLITLLADRKESTTEIQTQLLVDGIMHSAGAFARRVWKPDGFQVAWQLVLWSLYRRICGAAACLLVTQGPVTAPILVTSVYHQSHATPVFYVTAVTMYLQNLSIFNSTNSKTATKLYSSVKMLILLNRRTRIVFKISGSNKRGMNNHIPCLGALPK
jgi:hypothetical protein